MTFAGLFSGLARWVMLGVLSRLVRALRLERTLVVLAQRLFPGLQSTFLGGLLGSFSGLPMVLLVGWGLPRLFRALRARGRRTGRWAAPAGPRR